MSSQNRISRQLRSDLIDGLTLGPHHWAGAMDEDQFLSRLYDLRSMPTTDHRRSLYPTAAEDIHKHRVDNRDGPDDWVFSDSRFNLRHAPDADFLRFLVETVHPAVRPNPEHAVELTRGYNELLRQAGWELVETRRAGEHVYYVAAAANGIRSPAEVTVAPPDYRDATVLNDHLTRLRRDLDADPAAAIAHCKELLESQCKLVLEALRVESSDREDLPKLYRKTAEALGIHAAAVPGDNRASDAIRGMLRSLAALVQNVAEARNAMGTGHGRATPSRAEPRHARLVFNATVAVAEYIAEVWARRR
ncbi:abortive infection family protein [Curtobacterium sp. TXMA1]|uniref:abortive infection family protein n=1 Tax=Curtobacterium sp. TXMA1 TaxID=2876939 RepID=UPI001CCDBF7D|nr:abortive infection family protein [Curtobacterium sp. TXMA1]UBQ01880.1 abortive infection family protein [Curtobacterium sp. TXMA1]